MEPRSAVELYKKAPVQSNCPAKDAVFIGDDDCPTLSKIRNENTGNTDGLQKAIRLTIVPHAFGNHEHCLGSWFGYKEDPTSYKHRDLPFGKDLLGESLKRSLEQVFEIYSSENVIKKLAHNASSQRNESLNSTIGCKNPKIRFHGGSESAVQRRESSVPQKNLGKQYLLSVLQSANINPARPTLETKQHRNVRSGKGSRLELQVGTVYESGTEIYQFEQQVPQFYLRKARRYQTFNLGFEYNFVIYNTETNCGGKKGELVELSYFCHSTGDSFRKFVLLQHDSNVHASHVNKFRIASFSSEHVLHRNSFALQTASLPECLLSFANFLKSTSPTIKNTTSKPVKILLIRHTIAHTYELSPNKVLFQSKLEIKEQIVNNSNTMILSTVQKDVQYLDKAHDRLLTFNNRLYDD
ncbi:hypothetical protein P5673_023112 [Acropora cervicornis]|uniref:Uncharacterized protein n=1 Tax=Acropora cervicornis TaxID=6130 RepID=A0AAD9Q5I1_ACRCE|nr:hypothetical protein P5673_023112 [Acropora cervicornis]